MKPSRSASPPDIQIPKIEESGKWPFLPQDLRELVQWTKHPEWPDGALSIYELEGLLVSLLVLPLALRPGVWLPYLWNGRGWRVPDFLRVDQRFQHFIGLVIGFMRAHDARLSARPPELLSVLDAEEFYTPGEDLRSRIRSWVRGFGLLIEQSENFKVRPALEVRRLLFTIAMHGKPVAGGDYQERDMFLSLGEAVLKLAVLRTSRGPLGLLPGATQTERRRVSHYHSDPGNSKH